MMKKSYHSEARSNRIKSNTEPYKLHENSINKDKNFEDNTIKSKLFHTHLEKIFSKNRKPKSFSFDSLYKIDKRLDFDKISNELDKFISETKTGEKFRKNEILFKDLIIKFLGFDYNIGIYLTIFSNLFMIPVPILVKRLIAWVESENTQDPLSGYKYSLALITCLLLNKLTLFWSLRSLFYGVVMSKAVSQVKNFLSKNRLLL